MNARVCKIYEGVHPPSSCSHWHLQFYGDIYGTPPTNDYAFNVDSNYISTLCLAIKNFVWKYLIATLHLNGIDSMFLVQLGRLH